MNVTICIGSSCHLKGSREIVHTLERLVQEYKLKDQVELNGSFCMGNCMKGVCVKVDDQLFSLSPEDTEEFFKEQILGRITV